MSVLVLVCVRYASEQQLQQSTGDWVLRGSDSMAAERDSDLAERRDDGETLRAIAS